jgi:hypothetical protein
MYTIVKQQSILEQQLFQEQQALRGLYASTFLHCVNCQRNEIARDPPDPEPGSSIAKWPAVLNGSRWMFYQEPGVLESSWKFKHVVIEEGTVALHNHTLHKSKTPMAHFPITPSTVLMDAKQKQEDLVKVEAEMAEAEAKKSGALKAGKAVVQAGIQAGIQQFKKGEPFVL